MKCSSAPLYSSHRICRACMALALTGRGRLRLAPYQWYSARHTGSGTVSKSRPGTSCRERFSLPPSRVNVGACADKAHSRLYRTRVLLCELQINRQLPNFPKGSSVNPAVYYMFAFDINWSMSFLNRKRVLDSSDVSELERDFLYSKWLCEASEITLIFAFMGSVLTRDWLSMAPGLCAARCEDMWPLAPEKHWLLLSDMLCWRAKQLSVLEGATWGLRAAGAGGKGTHTGREDIKKNIFKWN